MNILLVSNDATVRDSVMANLHSAGMAAEPAAKNPELFDRLAAVAYRLVILDFGLRTDHKMLSMIKNLREKQWGTPVMVLSERGETPAVINALAQGADAYVVKPYVPADLVARIRALLRRAVVQHHLDIEGGKLDVDHDHRRVFLGGTELTLSQRESALLFLLLADPTEVCSRRQIRAAVYGQDNPVAESTIETLVHSLRKKLGAESIETIRGNGYRFVTRQQAMALN
ncbi:response regulator transcription factor [Silvimonas iriomotensis]|uniref:DNA-binding response regulator n=1 Tax=Silvimonas iriomotensis TaxID=449662 RepID=A0ABQ2P9Y8_9NEIS|nr:response regulator transcription factor [Silvimonas iriomotensis]GGP22071.1 DNA-binding response regulator [Silvimonas iriomotensis]